MIEKLGWVAALCVAGCAAEVGSSDEAVSANAEALRGGREIAFEVIEDPAGVGTAGEDETGRIVRSAREYRRLFGHAPPAGVDFSAGEAVAFYSGGVQPTGGYEASIQGISLVRGRLLVSTLLVSPGADCIVTQALSKPYALVKFDAPRRARGARFVHDYEIRDCTENPCDLVRCAAGTQCEVQPDGSATCVATGPFCDGIAGVACPGAGQCVDDPTDDCDPTMGGNDCGGRCICTAIGLCVDGFVWNDSPDICGCVEDGGDVNPCAFTLCPVGTSCELENGEAVCVPNGAQECGNAVCAEGQVCCNWSCGICTEPGGFCTQQACDEEEPQP